MENNNQLDMSISGYQVQIFGFDIEKAAPVVYVHTLSKEEGPKLWSILQGKCVLICIVIDNWNSDLSPWKADRAFKQGEDFDGQAGRYLNTLVEKIIPETEKILHFHAMAENRCLAGYSMAGLFAVYAIYQVNLFGKIVSASGSLWFDRFVEYAEKEPVLVDNLQIYLSVGDKERNVRNVRMSTVQENTERLSLFYQEKGYKVIYEVNLGGHFNEPIERLCKGILSII